MGHNMGTEIEKRAPISLMVAPSKEDCGPAMAACSELQRKFIVALVELGADNYTRAALMTGHFSTEASAQAWSSRMMHSQKVLSGLREHTELAIKGDVHLARRALMEIAKDPLHKDRLKAAVELFNRNGMIVETVQRHIVQDDRETKEIIRSAIEYAKQAGVDPKALLGNSFNEKDFIDAEFTEVSPKQPAMSSDGLEDVLA